MVAKSGNKKRYFKKDILFGYNLKPVHKSRLANIKKESTSIIKSLFMKKKQKELSNSYGSNFSVELADS